MEGGNYVINDKKNQQENINTENESVVEEELDNLEEKDNQNSADNVSDKKEKDFDIDIEQLIEEQKMFKAELLKTRADLDNLHKRSQRMVEEAKENSSMNIVRSFIPVLDELIHALDYVSGIDHEDLPKEVKLVFDGIKMTISKFTGVLNKYGIEQINPNLGDEFDSNFHNAVFEEENKDYELGSIVRVLQIGYKIKNSLKLIRPASVAVSK